MSNILKITALAGALALAAACGTDPAASYDERMKYLQVVAQRGANMHTLLASQDAKIDPDRCGQAYDGIKSPDIVPDVAGSAGNSAWVSKEWAAQVKAFFVDSCVSGKPRPVASPAAPSAGPSTSSTGASGTP